MTKLIEAFNRASAIWRHLIMAGGVLTLMWGGIEWVLTPHIEAFAQETVLEILEDNGITPQGIADLQNKVNEIAKEQKQAGDDLTALKGDVGALKDDVGDVKEQNVKQNNELGLIKQETTESGKQLDKIVDFLINRRQP
jgi:peptidoglycan hydrolase CwlO-like protein